MAIAEPYRSAAQTPALARHKTSRLMRVRIAGRRVAWVDRTAIAALVLLVVAALAAPLLAPYSPISPVGAPFMPPSGKFLLGTDNVGYDILSRVLYGLRTSIFAAVLVITSGVVIGGLIGLIAGAVGGWVDNLLMRVTDIFLALPGPILAIGIVAALGPGFIHTLIGVGVVWWPFYARITRGEVRGYAARPHLEAARLSGVPPVRRALRHLLPGAFPAVLVTASLDVGGLVVTLAGLSFLGLGAPAPAPELGEMSVQGMQFLLAYWWIPIMPAAAVLLLALLANLAGDGVSDMIGDR